MLTAAIEQFLHEQWQSRIDSKFLYRGMSARDLVDPLDPETDPFSPIRPPLLTLIERLYLLLDAGFEFTVHEDHSGYDFSLRDILNWTAGDLANPGLDFTSSHEGACGYGRNFQGSQLRQNFKYITEHLPERQNDPHVRQLWTNEDWQTVGTVHRWVANESIEHQQIVLWVRRSHPAFESEREDGILRGSCDFFRQRTIAILEQRHLPYTIEAITTVLPPADYQFDVRMKHPLPLADIERIEIRE